MPVAAYTATVLISANSLTALCLEFFLVLYGERKHGRYGAMASVLLRRTRRSRAVQPPQLCS